MGCTFIAPLTLMQQLLIAIFFHFLLTMSMMEMLKGQFESVTTPLVHYVHNFPQAFNYWLLFAQINDGIMSDHDLLGGVTYIKMPSTFFIAFKKSIISEYGTQEENCFLKYPAHGKNM